MSEKTLSPNVHYFTTEHRIYKFFSSPLFRLYKTKVKGVNFNHTFPNRRKVSLFSECEFHVFVSFLFILHN